MTSILKKSYNNQLSLTFTDYMNSKRYSHNNNDIIQNVYTHVSLSNNYRGKFYIPENELPLFLIYMIMR